MSAPATSLEFRLLLLWVAFQFRCCYFGLCFFKCQIWVISFCCLIYHYCSHSNLLSHLLSVLPLDRPDLLAVHRWVYVALNGILSLGSTIRGWLRSSMGSVGALVRDAESQHGEDGNRWRELRIVVERTKISSAWFVSVRRAHQLCWNSCGRSPFEWYQSVPIQGSDDIEVISAWFDSWSRPCVFLRLRHCYQSGQRLCRNSFASQLVKYDISPKTTIEPRKHLKHLKKAWYILPLQWSIQRASEVYFFKRMSDALTVITSPDVKRWIFISSPPSTSTLAWKHWGLSKDETGKKGEDQGTLKHSEAENIEKSGGRLGGGR